MSKATTLSEDGAASVSWSDVGAILDRVEEGGGHVPSESDHRQLDRARKQDPVRYAALRDEKREEWS